jgi:WD40 repeat protein
MIFFDAGTGEEAGIAAGHTAAVSAFSFSADGKRLATGDESGTVKVWSVATE